MSSYKSGKGRKPKRQQKVFKMKKGGPKFWPSGKVIAPSPIMMAQGLAKPQDQGSMVKTMLQSMGFRVAER